jgi:hypothetical protein
MAQAVSHWPLTMKAQVLAFVVDKVSLEQANFRVLLFFNLKIIPSWVSMLIYHLGDKEQFQWWSAAHRHSLTPIDMNNSNNNFCVTDWKLIKGRV